MNTATWLSPLAFVATGSTVWEVYDPEERVGRVEYL
jgi:hypothetical protein